MSVTVHGEPGRILQRSGDRKYGTNARRGIYFERQVARALEQWLTARPDHFHLFHDLEHFDDVCGAGLEPLSLGRSNIDHLILTGETWLIVDAKGCGAGTLGVDCNGNGRLLKNNGTSTREEWLDDRSAYSRAGAVFRLTDGLGGATSWIVPDRTLLHPSVESAACQRDGGDHRDLGCAVLPFRAISDGFFDKLFPATQPVARSAHIVRIEAHLSV